MKGRRGGSEAGLGKGWVAGRGGGPRVVENGWLPVFGMKDLK